MTRYLRPIAWISLGVFVGMLAFATRLQVHALPEYGTRTGQPCTSCHVNPSGGGPRTLQGLLWVAEGRPDKLPALPGAEQKPSPDAPEGKALYQKFGCAACHGPNGEGGAGPALNREELPADELAGVIRNGKGTMLGYRSDMISDAELAALVRHVQAIGRGEIEAGSGLERQLLPPPQLACATGQADPVADTIGCGGN